MIFQHTISAVLSGTKTQTRRVRYLGDRLGLIDGERAVIKDNGKARWVVGKTYAIHRRRGFKAEPGIRLLVTRLRSDRHPLGINESDARAEGFNSSAAFAAEWRKLHGPRRQENDPAWVIEFKLVSSSPSNPACLSPTDTRGFEASAIGGAA